MFTEIKSRTSKPVALWCYNDGWEIFVNEAVKFLKLVVFGICSS